MHSVIRGYYWGDYFIEIMANSRFSIASVLDGRRMEDAESVSSRVCHMNTHFVQSADSPQGAIQTIFITLHALT